MRLDSISTRVQIANSARILFILDHFFQLFWLFSQACVFMRFTFCDHERHFPFVKYCNKKWTQSPWKENNKEKCTQHWKTILNSKWTRFASHQTCFFPDVLPLFSLVFLINLTELRKVTLTFWAFFLAEFELFFSKFVCSFCKPEMGGGSNENRRNELCLCCSMFVFVSFCWINPFIFILKKKTTTTAKKYFHLFIYRITQIFCVERGCCCCSSVDISHKIDFTRLFMILFHS